MEIPVWKKEKPYALVMEDGSWLNYANYWHIRRNEVKVVFIEPFEAKLRLDGFSRGRSAANFDLVNADTGARYTMFMKDFLEYIQTHGNVTEGILKGTWTVVKRGQNYGIKHV